MWPVLPPSGFPEHPEAWGRCAACLTEVTMLLNRILTFLVRSLNEPPQLLSPHAGKGSSDWTAAPAFLRKDSVRGKAFRA
jgi:hypothetical protein